MELQRYDDLKIDIISHSVTILHVAAGMLYICSMEDFVFCVIVVSVLLSWIHVEFCGFKKREIDIIEFL